MKYSRRAAVRFGSCPWSILGALAAERVVIITKPPPLNGKLDAMPADRRPRPDFHAHRGRRLRRHRQRLLRPRNPPWRRARRAASGRSGAGEMMARPEPSTPSWRS